MPNPQEAYLRFEDVSLAYGDAGEQSSLAVEGLNLSVAAGESIALIGPSGCGKSSSLRMAAGLIAPSSGKVFIQEQEVEGPRKGTALILQDFGLLPWKTVLANAELGLKVRHVAKPERRERAMEALSLVGLEKHAASFPQELSGGMKQRLAIARALALDVELMLMDEPLSALDALLREQLQQTLLELQQSQGYAQVLVTHSIEEAVFLGHKIVVMAPSPGHVVAIVDNPGVASADFRGSEEYFACCKQLRGFLHEHCGGDDDAA